MPTSSGLYRIKAGETRWTHVSDSSAFASIVATEGLLFAGFKNRPGLYYRSTDEGVTWSIVNVGGSSHAFNGPLVAAEWNADTLFAISDVGVYLSLDSGTNWVSIGAALNAVGPNRLFSVGGSLLLATGKKIFRHIPGKGWLPPTIMDTSIMSGFSFFGDAIMVTCRNGYYLTTDTGSSWKGPFGTYHGAALALSNVLFTEAGPAVSFDTGSSWTDIGLPPAQATTLQMTRFNHHLIARTLNSIWEIADTGHMTELREGLILGVKDLKADGDTLYALTVNGVFNSTDNGDSWKYYSSFIIAGRDMRTMGKHGQDCFVGGQGFYSSTDYGSTWGSVGGQNDFLNINGVAIDDSTVYAAANGEFYLSYDHGLRWKQPIVPQQLFGLYVFPEVTLLATKTSLYRTTDHGHKWDSIVDPLNRHTPQGMTEHQGALYRNVGFLQRSTDLGLSWSDSLTAMPDSGNAGALWSYDDKLYTQGRDGFYVSQDLGVTWKHINQGLEKKTVNLVATKDYLFTGTDRAVWRRPIRSLGIANKQSKNSFQVYPNPCKDVLNVQMDGWNNDIEIFDALGRAVYRARFAEALRSKAIAVHRLSAGVYTVRVSNEHGRQATKLLKTN